MAKNGKSSWLKWVVILVVLAALAAGAVWYFKGRGGSPITYQTTPVERGEVVQAVTATGTLNPVVNVTVGSQISGRINKLNVDFNSVVTSNQVIAEIDPLTYQANIERAEADLSNSMASLELSQLEEKRAAQLFTNTLISESDYDTAVATRDQAVATVRIKQAALDSAKVDLSRCTIYSPVDGVVISRNVDVGQTVAASLSAPVLFQIANDLTKMQIDASVAEADVGGVEVGQDVEFTVDAFPYRTFYGFVQQVRNAPATVNNVVTYDTVITVTNADYKLKPGMTANVSIIVARREDALKISNAALRFRPPEGAVPTNAMAQAAASPTNAPPPTNGVAGPGGGRSGRGGRGGRGSAGGDHAQHAMMRTVYVLSTGASAQGGKAELKPVQIRVGISDGIYTEVVSGLNEGDQVVTSSAGGASSGPTQGGMPGGFGRRF